MVKSVRPYIRYFGVKRQIGHQRQIRILVDLFEFHQAQRSDRVLYVDYDGEVRCTLHTIIWRWEWNKGRRRQIRILVDPFKFKLSVEF